MKRIMIYSHDTFGLGNIRRMLEVARHLVASSAELSVMVVSGSPMLHAFRLPERIDYIKLPCLSRNVEGRYGARSLPLTLEGIVRLRANLIRSAIVDFEPDLVLVDKKPFGVEDELAGAFESLPRLRRRPRLVLLLRDILDSAESTIRVWRKKGYYEAVSVYYDQVLVVGSPEIFDLTREYAFPPFAAAKVQFCGYIGRFPGRVGRVEMRRRLGVAGDAPLVLVTPGGGEDGYELVTTALSALCLMPASRRPRAHIVCGPEMSEPRRTATREAASAMPGVMVEEFCDDMMSLVGASDVVLAMGGYNTVCELLSLRRRAVLVPRVRPCMEQHLRAERMSAMGLVSMVEPDELTPHALLAALERELSALALGRKPPRLGCLNGLQGVTRSILELIGMGVEQAVTDPDPVFGAWQRRNAAAPRLSWS